MNVDKKNGNVCYNDEQHVYWDAETNNKYISVTTLIHKYQQPFDNEFWSMYKAIERVASPELFKSHKSKFLKNKKINIDDFCFEADLDKDILLTTQQEVKSEWEETNRISTERGTAIHNELENSYYKSGVCEMKKYGVGGKFTCKKDYYQLDLERGVYPEYLVHYESEDGKLKIAGQIDLLIKDGNDILIIDYKTNKKLDMKSFFDSKTKKNTGLKYPLNHIMDCNFMHYTLQLSMYAMMVEKMNPDFRVRTLMLVHHDHSGKVTEYPVEYLKKDIKIMMEDYKKQLTLEAQAARRKPIVF